MNAKDCNASGYSIGYEVAKAQTATHCGLLAREVAHLDKVSIHRAAMQRYGNWTEQLNDYCPTSGFLMDDVITTMLNAGFDIEDLRHLETLSDTEVLRTLPPLQRYPQHIVRGDVVSYLRAWAALLKGKASGSISEVNEVEEQVESKARDSKELPAFADADTTTRFSKREAIIVEL